MNQILNQSFAQWDFKKENISKDLKDVNSILEQIIDNFRESKEERDFVNSQIDSSHVQFLIFICDYLGFE